MPLVCHSVAFRCIHRSGHRASHDLAGVVEIVLSRSVIPNCGSYWLRHARLPGDDRLVDLHVADGMVAAMVPGGTAAEGPDLAGCQVWPRFVDVHTHLDKGHVWTRAPNPDGTFGGALAAVAADRARWTAADLRRRMEHALLGAYAHGTVALRTHLDSAHPGAAEAWRIFRSLRDEWSGRIALQAVSLTALDAYGGEAGDAIADTVADSGGVLGGVTKLGGAWGDPVPNGFQEQVDRLFALAEARDLDLDLHVDESGEPGARALGLIARTAIRRGFKGRVLCGHCCSLAVQPEEAAQDTIAAVADAGIAVVSLPMCNLYRGYAIERAG